MSFYQFVIPNKYLNEIKVIISTFIYYHKTLNVKNEDISFRIRNNINDNNTKENGVFLLSIKTSIYNIGGDVLFTLIPANIKSDGLYTDEITIAENLLYANPSTLEEFLYMLNFPIYSYNKQRVEFKYSASMIGANIEDKYRTNITKIMDRNFYHDSGCIIISILEDNVWYVEGSNECKFKLNPEAVNIKDISLTETYGRLQALAYEDAFEFLMEFDKHIAPLEKTRNKFRNSLKKFTDIFENDCSDYELEVS